MSQVVFKFQPHDLVRFTYENYKGAVSVRHAIFFEMFHGTTEFHKEPQLIIRGWDMDKAAIREYAAKDMKDITYA